MKLLFPFFSYLPVVLLAGSLLAGAPGCASKSLNAPVPADGSPPSSDARDSGDAVAAVDMRAIDFGRDAAQCACAMLNSALTMSWECYCATYGDCSQTLSQIQTHPACDGRRRTDFQSCGLDPGFSVLDFNNIGTTSYVYDSSGRLVGAYSVSDNLPYACPSDPSITSQSIRVGTFPDPSCLGRACDSCAEGSFPCPLADGGVDGPTD
jgi:hypothetical protein